MTEPRPYIDPARIRSIMEPEVRVAKIIEAEDRRARAFGMFLASLGGEHIGRVK